MGNGRKRGKNSNISKAGRYVMKVRVERWVRLVMAVRKVRLEEWVRLVVKGNGSNKGKARKMGEAGII